jgi:hypothetical protein
MMVDMLAALVSNEEIRLWYGKKNSVMSMSDFFSADPKY